MKKLFAIIVITAVGFGCTSSYNQEGVEKLLDQKGVRAWTDTFVNNSNLMTIKRPMGVVVSAKEIPQYQVEAIKAYVKDQHEVDKVHYYYRPEAYDKDYLNEE